MYFQMSLITAIALNAIAILSNLAVCCLKKKPNLCKELLEITSQCRWLGLLFFGLAWFIGNGTAVASGKTTYSAISYWLMIVAIGWMVLYALTMVAKIWNTGEKNSAKAAVMGIICFLLSYLLH